MKSLNDEQMNSVSGGDAFDSVINTFDIFNGGGSVTPVPPVTPVTPVIPDPVIPDPVIPDPVVPPSSGTKKPNDFEANMKRMFGPVSGRDLAKLAEMAGVVSVVNTIFGWKY